jgi:ActR/RegA family two-component response regulator
MASALLIDDDEGLLASIRRAAEAKGLDLATAADWDEGLALFQILGPNLVVADYNLPGSRHGLQLLAEVAQLRPSVRLILVSGALTAADLQKVEGLGLVDRVLAKTGSASRLVEEISSAASRAEEAIDWAAGAEAFLTREEVSTVDLDALDDTLRTKISPSD